MGPYCKYCGTRCFVHLTVDWPEHILKAYSPYTIAATCPDGQAVEKRLIGWCYDDARAVMDTTFAAVRIILQKIYRERSALAEILRRRGYSEEEMRAASIVINGATMNLLGAIDELLELPLAPTDTTTHQSEVANGV